MKNLISISEAVAEIALAGEGTAELYVSVDGTYDEAHSLLSVTLDSDLRSLTGAAHLERPAWLPASQSLQEHVEADEATMLARDVFQHWVEKVRRAIPSDAFHASATDSSEL